MAVVSTATLHARADQAAQAGDFPAALAASAEALRAVPQDHRARLKVGLCLAMLGQTDDAVAALIVVAESLAHQGFMLSAIGACRDALGLAADDARIHAALVAIHAQIRDAENRPRGRVPPPIPPSTVDDEASGSLVGLPQNEVAAAAKTLALAAPNDGEPTPAEHVPLFSELSADAFAALVPKINYLKVGAEHSVIQQGQAGTSVYILLEGEVRVVRDGDEGAQELARLSGGSLFGELALLTDKPRQANVVTTQPSELFEIDRSSLEAVAEAHPQLTEDIAAFARRRLLLNVMATSPLFQPFEAVQRIEILKQFESRVVDAGTALIVDGERPDGLFVVVEGEVEVSKVDDAGDRVMLAYLRAGDVFGEISVVEDKPATADVRTVEKSVVLCLEHQKFKATAEAHPAILAMLKELSGVRQQETQEAMADGIVLDADDLIIL